jgi:large subunit ribosomal protein L21
MSKFSLFHVFIRTYTYINTNIDMESYAIVQASGKQFWVEENKFYDFDKLPLDKGDTFTLNQILLVNHNSLTKVGKPFLDTSYTVQAKVLRHLSGPKIRVYKMRPKKKTRKTFGSRRKLTRVLITNISEKSS